MSITFKQYLTEAPLPASWDKSEYKGSKFKHTFKRMVAYAKARSKQVGAGSSRVAFKIPYEGRRVVLKIAKNSAGLAQNEHEVKVFKKQYDILIPIIDYDKTSKQPTWVCMELAKRVTEDNFERVCGCTLATLIYWVKMLRSDPTGENRGPIPPAEIQKNDTVKHFLKFATETNLTLNDFSRFENWGLYKGRLVIIDFGINDDILNTYYSY